MTKIYLIRHAEAEGNYYRRIHGHYDSHITARGYQQIDALAQRFKNIELDALYSSDLIRTMTTAGAITRYHDLSIVPEPRLREVNMGVWEDRTWGNVGYDEPEQLARFSSDPAKWDIPGREDFYHLQDRIFSILTELADRHAGQTIAAVSHGMAIRSLVCKILGLAPENISQVPHGDNTCVALLNFDKGRFTLEYYNDNSHLGDSLSTFARQSWWKNDNRSLDASNLRLLPMDIEADKKLYKSCYGDAWSFAHGSLGGFDGNLYYRAAREASKKEPLALMKVFSVDSFVGIVELDPIRSSELGAGWISFFYLIPEFRGRGYGPQLLGHAVSVFRGKGRRSIRLHVAETNETAIRFYQRNGFQLIAKEPGIGSQLLLMEKSI